MWKTHFQHTNKLNATCTAFNCFGINHFAQLKIQAGERKEGGDDSEGGSNFRSDQMTRNLRDWLRHENIVNCMWRIRNLVSLIEIAETFPTVRDVIWSLSHHKCIKIARLVMARSIVRANFLITIFAILKLHRLRQNVLAHFNLLFYFALFFKAASVCAHQISKNCFAHKTYRISQFV